MLTWAIHKQSSPSSSSSSPVSKLFTHFQISDQTSVDQPFSSDVAVIFPVRIPIHHTVTLALAKGLAWARVVPPIHSEDPPRRRHVVLNYITVPLFSVLLLLATKAIDGPIVKRGIVGDDGIQPLNILALFISLVGVKPSLIYGKSKRELIVLMSGVSVHLARLHGPSQVLCVLGRSERRLIRSSALFLPLRVLLGFRCHRWECKHCFSSPHCAILMKVQ